MLIRRGERYRLYPAPVQVERLTAWENALRWLWNNAHAERLVKLETGYVLPTAFNQINDLTALRAAIPWLADVPRNVCAQVLVELDKAWQRGFAKIAKMPRFKSRSRGDRAPMIEPAVACFRIEGHGRGGVVVFPKLGKVRAVIHRAIVGKAKTFAIVRDGDQWFACVSCVVEIADPLPSTKPPIALDVGVAKLVADSGGGFVENPRHAEALQPRIRRAQRTVARRKSGSNNQKKAKGKVARLQRTARRQREHTLHKASKHYAKNHGTVIVEALNVQGMTCSAKGTVEEPGTKVAEKSGLNRSIQGAGWARFVGMLAYKVESEGGVLLRRTAAYSSQECSRCEHIDAASRRTQSLFACTACGHMDHADTNAAQTLLSRWERETAVETTEAVCGGTAARERPVKQKLRVVRRGTRLKVEAHGVTPKASTFTAG